MEGVLQFVIGGLIMTAAACVPLVLLSMWADWRASRE